MTLFQRNFKLIVTYDGSTFFGFQLQPDCSTIQGTLEEIISSVVGEKVRILGAGRTDTGVHALGQVASFKTNCKIPVEKLVFCLNERLPDSVRVLSVEEVNKDFHPRFMAKGKHYRYIFRTGKLFSPFLSRYSFQVSRKLDIGKMSSGAEKFLGEYDFAAFAKSPGKVENSIRKMFASRIEVDGDFVFFDIVGSGFLHNMVRNMAKALFLIGKGEMKPCVIDELYENQDRTHLGSPAPPGGLYLMKVMY
ncbi:MAG: tRNA pseudouridine(38-40) synthase TruA [Candidatus Riflebacteria bacterium]|nr:tRNA pseudouridine(38-40) synthase TruA [Candidatus Riflebacteria bacterium]